MITTYRSGDLSAATQDARKALDEWVDALVAFINRPEPAVEEEPRIVATIGRASDRLTEAASRLADVKAAYIRRRIELGVTS